MNEILARPMLIAANLIDEITPPSTQLVNLHQS